MWTVKDNGKDVSWKGALKYCRNLRLADHTDWRLPNLLELQGIFDASVNAPGLSGLKSEPTMWHVKGNLFLTLYEWSSNCRLDDRGRCSGYVSYFDFIAGKSNDQPTGWPYPYSGMRALCVRGSGDPLGSQREH
jgi:hypothetical protein